MHRAFKPYFLCGVSKARSFIKYWLLPVLWMALIFSASGDNKSFEHSSRILAPILRWLFPHISHDALNSVVTIIRKCAHLTEYAILAILFWRALRKPVKKDLRPWSWKEAKMAVLFVALYAASDEFHQRFVPSRQASVIDVLIDTIGGSLGLLLIWMIGRWRERW